MENHILGTGHLMNMVNTPPAYNRPTGTNVGTSIVVQNTGTVNALGLNIFGNNGIYSYIH